MSTKKEEKSSPQKRPGQSLGGRLSFIILLAWIVSMVVNMFDWHTRGYTALMQKINEEYIACIEGLCARDETASAYFNAGLVLVERHADALFELANQTIKPLVSPFSFFELKRDKNKQRIASLVAEEILHFFSVMAGTTKVLAAKIMAVASSFWLYVFSSFLGALDGLVKRYIRTAEGGRESTFVFHKISGIMIQCLFWVLTVYLVIPDSFSPEIAVILMSLFLFSYFTIATSQLKKYL